MRYVLKVAYDGTNFCGWQIQPNGRTVQQDLNDAAFSAFGERVCVVASGRTDSGVHAKAQICHVDIQRPIEGEKVADALNFYLKEDVSVLASAVAPRGFDATRSAKKKTYTYSMYVSSRRNPLKERYSVRLKKFPDTAKMRRCADMFVGEHDFAAYCSAGSQVRTTTRTIYSFSIEEREGDISVAVCGNGFLYNMVRTLVGTALNFAEGKLSEDDIIRSLNGGGRGFVGKTMPPKGLTLTCVDYACNLFSS